MNDRQLKIIGFLLKNPSKISTKDLAERFSVSRRTIFNDLNILDEYLESNSYKLIRNDGSGIYIEKLQNEEIVTIGFDEFFENRRKLNILKLILFEGYLDTFDICEHLYISESSLLNDISSINNEILADITVEFKIRDYQINLDLSEIEIQKIYQIFNKKLLEQIKRTVIDEDSALENYNLFLKKLYGADIVNFCREILYKYIYENTEKLAEYYFSNLMNSFIVLMYRKKENKNIVKDGKNELIDNDAEKLINEMEDSFSHNFNEDEKSYIYDLLKANKIASFENDKDSKLVSNFISDMSNILDVDFKDDKVLSQQLTSHIPSMLYRLENKILIDNPFLIEIKKEYHILFSAIWMTLLQNDDLKKYKFNDQEVGLLTIYIQAAVDRNDIKKHIALYNSNRMVDNNFIYSRVKNILNNNLILNLIDDEDNLKNNVAYYDIILSTDKKLNIKGKPIIYIPLVLRNVDLIKINQEINNILLSSSQNMGNESTNELFEIIDKYFLKETSFFNMKFSNKKELLNFALDYLIDGKYVDKNYKDAVFNRESQGSTELGDFMAIPHGNPDYVKISNICFISLKDSVLWKENDVSYIAILSIKKEDLKDLRDILFIVDKLASEQDIDKMQNVKEFNNFIKNIKEIIGS